MVDRQPLFDWSDVQAEDWSHFEKSAYVDTVVFELTRLPNFAEPRFRTLGESLEERKAAMARRQMEMLIKLHELGPQHAIVLRYRRFQDRLHLYVIVRVAHAHPLTPDDRERLAARVLQSFPAEYHPERLTPEVRAADYAHALDLTWARSIEELLKPEDVQPSDSWPFYYTCSLWQSVSSNDMEALCRALLTLDGDAMVEVLLIPSQLHALEREFINTWTQRMREAVGSGEKLMRGDQVILRFDPRPTLRGPLENYEKLMERYSRGRLCLSAIRVYATTSPASVSAALAASASRSTPQKVQVDLHGKSHADFLKRASRVDLDPAVRAPWWDHRPRRPDGDLEQRPYKVQRLHRLVDLDEVASFWRLPIPVAAGFPGFELDIRREGGGGDGSPRREDIQLALGKFTDDTASTLQRATFDRENLAKHGLIVGVPGSGKTTMVFNLLHQLWSVEPGQARVPFIVLEPAKTEYRALQQLDGLRDDLLVFTLGDERLSPFRFNPFAVPAGIALESHLSRLNACFVGAFNLFDPLPLLLDKAIRLTYERRGWYDDSVGGDPQLRTPTLSDLVEASDDVIRHSGYSDKLRDDFNAALLQRLESLRRGSKGRMLDSQQSIPFDTFMSRPVVLELDALNEDEKSLLMMFVLTFVYEYARSTRRSGSPLRHVLVVEEAHNLIGRGDSGGSEYRANPKEQAIRLFTRMLAEMRALGQGILIADQLPTALAPEAVKQTNLKILMRMTSMDDRVEIGNTMDIGEAELKDVARFKSGQAYIYLEDWDRIRQVQTPNFKEQHGLGEPPDDDVLTERMHGFEEAQPELFMPFTECAHGCTLCNRRLRNRAERFVRPLVQPGPDRLDHLVTGARAWDSLCKVFRLKAMVEAQRLYDEDPALSALLPFCAFVHALHLGPSLFRACEDLQGTCDCKVNGRTSRLDVMLATGQTVVQRLQTMAPSGGSHA